jgi:GNAT superfamily N-acetyltransferase
MNDMRQDTAGASRSAGPTNTPDMIHIRPLTSDDRERLADAFARLSDETRRRRFLSAATRLSERDLDALTGMDHHGHEALAAVAPRTGAIVGVARYIRLPRQPGAAEVAIAVDDAWQRRGIGRRLLTKLVDHARGEGVSHLTAYVGADNGPVRSWIRRLGGVALAQDGDAVLYGISLDAPAERRNAA